MIAWDFILALDGPPFVLWASDSEPPYKYKLFASDM